MSAVRPQGPGPPEASQIQQISLAGSLLEVADDKLAAADAAELGPKGRLGIVHEYPAYSLWILHRTNPLRRLAVVASHNKVTEHFILFCILCNCVTLALSSGREGFERTPLGKTLTVLEYVWVAIFSAEALLKIVSMGFVLSPGTYLRDGWNSVDFTVVVLGYVDIFTSGNLTALRTVRVLRPLRAVTRIRGMRVLVTTMIESLPMLMDVFLLCAFTFFIFGLVAVQLFAGILQYRCGTPVFTGAYTTPDSSGRLVYHNVSYVVPPSSTDDMCSGPYSHETSWLDIGGNPTAVTGSNGDGDACPVGMYCTRYGNPFYGFLSFDHILWAWLAIFQCVTQEGWTDIQYDMQAAFSWWVWPFFVFLVVFGSFYIVNLALAVLYMRFAEDNHQTDGEEGKGKVKREDAGALASGKGREGDDGDEDDRSSDGSASDTGSQLRSQQRVPEKLMSKLSSRLPEQEVAALSSFRRAFYRVASSKALEATTMTLIVINTVVMCINWHRMPKEVEKATNYINYALTIYFLLEMAVKLVALRFTRYIADGMNIFDALVVAVSVTELILDIVPTVSGVGPLSVLRAFRLLRIFRLARSWRELNLIIRAMFKSVTSTAYLLFLMLLFMFISSLMGVQLFSFKFQFCDYVESATPTCPLGHRVWGDCPKHFHCYLPCSSSDYGSWVTASGSFYNDLAYCERFCANADAAAAADANATATAVAAAGGCEYLAMVGKSQVPRAQFDNVFWGLYTVFQLLTTENWPNIMWDGMRVSSPWVATYFIAVMLLGTYLVFNLFIAILLDNFSGTFSNGSQEASPQTSADGRPSDSGGVRAVPAKKADSSSDSDSDDERDRFGSMRSERTDLSGFSARSIKIDQTDLDELGGGSLHPLRYSSGGLGLRPELPSEAQSPEGKLCVQDPDADVVDSPRDVIPPLPKGVGRKVVPVDASGRPASSLSGGLLSPSRPVSAMVQPGKARVRPVSAARSGGGGVKFAADVAHRRASFMQAHEPAREQPTGGSTACLASSLRRSLKRAASSIRSIRDVRRSEHLVEFIKGRSLMLLDPDHWVRWRAARLVHHTYFEAVILVFIAISSVTLALDEPYLDPHSRLALALQAMDYVFTGIFAIEALLKIVTFGFAFTGKTAYIRNAWNILDFVIVLVGFALIAIDVTGSGGENLKMLRVLRTLRALRPLRAASRYEGLKVVVNALFAVLPAMGNVALVCILFYIIFAILAVNLFKGKLFNCINADTEQRLDPYYYLPPDATLTRSWCEAGSVQINASVYHADQNVSLPAYNITTLWVNPVANFDNVGNAILTLFQMATLELWVDIMGSGVDAVGVDKQPIYNHQPLLIVFFVFVIIVCSFFVLNLFIGVTLDKFTELQQAQTASSVLVTQQQQTWVDVQKMLLRTSMQLRPPRPDWPPWRELLYDLVVGARFDQFILAAILLNVMFMAMVHADMTHAWQDCMTYSNLIFTSIFLAEAILKILAFGPLSYFRDKWNLFDFFVVLISVLSVALDFADTESLSFMPVLRVLRIIRVFRLVRRAQGLQRLLITLVQSLPALANVGAVMLLLFFIFAIIGMNLFGGIKHGQFLNGNANFDTFPNSMLTLMRMITGETWDGIMQDCMVTHDCVLVTRDTLSPATNATLLAGSFLDPGSPDLRGVPGAHLDNKCTLHPVTAVIYFPAFVVLCGFILLNLVIAVILENMMQSEADEGLPVSKSMMGQFVDAWSGVDPHATGFVHASKLPQIVAALEPPMGTLGDGHHRTATQSVIMSVDIPVRESNTVTFLETLHALSGRVAGTELPEIEEQWIIERYCRRLPGRSASFPKYTAAHFHAALYVQAAVRGFMARHKMRGMMSTFANRGPATGPEALQGAGKDPGTRAEAKAL